MHLKKFILPVLLAIITDIFLFLILSPFLKTQEVVSLSHGQKTIIETTNPLIPFFIILISLLIGFAAFLLQEKPRQIPPIPMKTTIKKIQDKEAIYKILAKALSDDEKKVLEEIKKSKEITQDSLRFRLEWSKPKLSAILTSLDRRGIIQRERTGKTYKVTFDKKLK